MSMQIQDLRYVHANNEPLFENISFALSPTDKCALVGNNGVGKSTLLGIMAGKLRPTAGRILCSETPYLVPQHFGQYNEMTVAQALGVHTKLQALRAILQGRGTETELLELDDEWDLEDRLQAAFAHWDIAHIDFKSPMGLLSGGEKTKVFLAGMDVHQPKLVLMDEPTNHLDMQGRALLFDYIDQANHCLLVVSHDRTLLNLLPAIYELQHNGIHFYPMSYDDYKATVDKAAQSLVLQLQQHEKEMAKAQKQAQKTLERQQKHQVRGEKQNAQKGLPHIAMGNLRSQSETSTAKLNKAHQKKMETLRNELSNTRAMMGGRNTMQVNLEHSALTNNKLLVSASHLTFGYSPQKVLWQQAPLHFSIYSGERIWLQGGNGSGKSTLLKLITGQLPPTGGTLLRPASVSVLFLDQEYSIIQNALTVFEQLESFSTAKPEHELKMLLNRFLFPSEVWDKKCAALSGGERMRLALCCLQVGEKAPDLLIADEPTNNIDITNMEILAETLNRYQGTLLVVSHDAQFVQDISLTRTLALET